MWDELAKEFNLIVLDPRDKETVKLSKKSKCTVQRIALDIAETIHHFRINKNRLIFFGSSIGASYIANCLRRNPIKPKCCFFAGPSIKPRNPKFLLKLTLILPSSIVDRLGKFVGRRYLRDKVAEGFQRKVFYNRVEKIDVRRWKKCFKIHNYNAAEDFKSIKCPTFIIRTKGDKYHHLKSLDEVHEIIENSQIVDVQSYDYFHTKPGVKDFVKELLDIIQIL